LHPASTAARPYIHVLGLPPAGRPFFKNGKAGTDVYNKSLALNNSILSVNAFLGLTGEINRNDLPFAGVTSTNLR